MNSKFRNPVHMASTGRRGSKRKFSNYEDNYGSRSSSSSDSGNGISSESDYESETSSDRTEDYGSETSSDGTEPVPKYFKHDDLERLQKIRDLADEYIEGCSYSTVNEFYRNKDHSYFNEIKQGDGMMRINLKDNGGDPHCPINGILEGLFFMCSPDNNSPPTSPFGPKRLILPAGYLLNAGTNLYFSDFFCVSSPMTHYISLVITIQGSQADTFCQQNLIELDKYDNPYLELVTKKKTRKTVYVAVKRHLWVEIFYTKDINISNIPLKVGMRESGPRYVKCNSMESNGKFATITSSGIRKRKHCSYCNPE